MPPDQVAHDHDRSQDARAFGFTKAFRIFSVPSSPIREKPWSPSNGLCARWKSAIARYQKLGVRGVEAFNERVRKAKDKGETLKRTVQTGFDRETGKPIYEDEVLELEPMPYIVVVVDEMAELMMVSGKEIEGAVQRLAQDGARRRHPPHRSHATSVRRRHHRHHQGELPHAHQLPGHGSKIDSRTILGEQGAEQLLGQGDMLYMTAGGRIRRVHGPFVSDHEVEDVVRFLKTQGRPKISTPSPKSRTRKADDPYALLRQRQRQVRRRPLRQGARHRRARPQGHHQLHPAPPADRLQPRRPPDRADGRRRRRLQAEPKGMREVLLPDQPGENDNEYSSLDVVGALSRSSNAFR